MAYDRYHGGPSLRVKRADLDARGVTRTTARFAAPGTAARCSTTAKSSTAPTWCGAPASARSSTGWSCPSSTTRAGRWSTSAWWPMPRASTSAASASSTPSARCCCPASAGTRRTSPSRSPPEERPPGGPACGALSSEDDRHAMGVIDNPARTREAYERREGAAAYEALSAREPRDADRRRLRPAGHRRPAARPPQRLHPGPAAGLRDQRGRRPTGGGGAVRLLAGHGAARGRRGRHQQQLGRPGRAAAGRHPGPGREGGVPGVLPPV